MIHGAGHSYEEWNVLSDFGRKWYATIPPKELKLGNTNKVQESNPILEEAV